MSVHIPPAQDCQPWHVMRELLNRTSNPKEFFALVQKKGKGLLGFIIVRWNEKGIIDGYIPEDRPPLPWYQFGDETVPESPRMYKTLQGIDHKVADLRDQEGERIGLAFWVHPQAPYTALEKYQETVGIQWPGTVYR